MTMDGCTDLCRSRHKGDCQHVVLHREDDGRLMCRELKEKPKEYHQWNKDPNYLSADRKCGWKKGDNDAQHEVDRKHPNFGNQLGSLVNLAIPKDMEQHLREVGMHRGKMLFDSTKRSCYKVKEYPRNIESGRDDISTSMKSISESASTTIGVSAGIGPVTASVETTFGTSVEKSESVYQRITEGWSYRRTRIIQGKCLTDHGFRLHVVENMKLRLMKMKKLEMPNKPTDISGWEKYWLHFQNFANDFGTHMVTEVNDGMRALRIIKKSSHTLTTGSSFAINSSVEAGFPLGPSAGASAGHSTESSESNSSGKELTSTMMLGTPSEIDINWDDVAGSLNKVHATQELKTVVSEVKQPLWAVLAPLKGFKELRTVIKRFAYWAEYVYANNGLKKPRCECENASWNMCKPNERASTHKKMCEVKTAPPIMIPRKAPNGSTDGGFMEELLPDIFVGSMCGDEEKKYSVRLRPNGKWTPAYMSVYTCNDCSSSHNNDEHDGHTTEQCLQKVTSEDWKDKAGGCLYQQNAYQGTNYCKDYPRYFPSMNLCCKSTCGFCNK